MKTYRITLAELQSIEIDVEANSEEEAEKKLNDNGWNYEDAEVRSIEVTVEDVRGLNDE